MKGNMKFMSIAIFYKKSTCDPIKINEYIRCRISFWYDSVVFIVVA